jgi:hypothetical protein
MRAWGGVLDGTWEWERDDSLEAGGVVRAKDGRDGRDEKDDGNMSGEPACGGQYFDKDFDMGCDEVSGRVLFWRGL